MTNDVSKPSDKNSLHEITKRLKEKLEKRLDDQNHPETFTEGLLIMGSELANAYSEHNENKTAEQKEIEKREAKIRHDQYLKDKSFKDRSKVEALFQKWLKRDTWLIYDEALSLMKAEKPEAESLLNPRDQELWSIVQSCAGQSLKIINQNEKPRDWRVTPFEWVRWLLEKKISVHPQLLALVYPSQNISPTIKTAKANNSREIHKAQRIKAIKEFLSKTAEFARKNNVEWNNQAIPVTKGDFLKVFYTQYPAFNNISGGTFDRDIADIGVKFKNGTKSNKNNVLVKLFGSK